MEGMLLYSFQQNELRDGVDMDDTLFQSLKSASTTFLFELRTSRSVELGTTMLLYNLKVKHGMSNAGFSKLLRYLIIKAPVFLRNLFIQLTLQMVDFMHV